VHRILSIVTTLEQHLIAVTGADSDIYRPLACPYCGMGGLWRHGCYYRKTDRCGVNSPVRFTLEG
jgi:hypothetical protein